MIDLTKPVQTRGGRYVRILATDLKAVYSVVGAIDDGHGIEILETWKPDGSYLYDGSVSDFDLVNRPTTYSRYVCVYRDGPDGWLYNSENKAVEVGSRNGNYIKTVKVEITA